jgi:hypothetical protein
VAVADVQRWSRKRKMEVVLRLLQGEPLDALSRELGIEMNKLEAWRTKALAGMALGLKEREGDPLQAELDSAKRHIGELMMEVELLREKAKRSGAFWPGRSRK